MNTIDSRNWIAPDGADYRVSVREFTIHADRPRRRIRRVEFESLDGRTVGSAAFPGYLALHLVTAGELESLWDDAVGG